MIENFSPSARKIMAIGIVLLFLLVTLEFLLLPIGERIGAARDALADSRFELARLENISRRPPPPKGDNVDPVLLVKAQNVKAAQAELQTKISSMAGSSGVTATLTFSETGQAIPGQVAGDLALAGTETAVTEFLSRLESGRPLIGQRRWNIAFSPELPGQVQYSAGIVAAWDSGQ